MPSRREAAKEIAESLRELRRRSEAEGMGFLAYLVDMAIKEAESEANKPGR